MKRMRYVFFCDKEWQFGKDCFKSKTIFEMINIRVDEGVEQTGTNNNQTTKTIYNKATNNEAHPIIIIFIH